MHTKQQFTIHTSKGIHPKHMGMMAVEWNGEQE